MKDRKETEQKTVHKDVQNKPMSKAQYNPNCVLCQIAQRKEQEAEQREITFVHDGQTLKATAKRYNDGFYEIVKGKFKGNLVHIFDLVKQNTAVSV